MHKLPQKLPNELRSYDLIILENSKISQKLGIDEQSPVSHPNPNLDSYARKLQNVYCKTFQRFCEFVYNIFPMIVVEM